MPKGRKARKTMTFENNFETMRQAVHAEPRRVLTKIGVLIRDTTRSKLKGKSGRLKNTVGFWARKKEGDLQVGYYNNYKDVVKTKAATTKTMFNSDIRRAQQGKGKVKQKAFIAFYKEAVKSENNPLLGVVQQHKEQITQLIGEALREVGYKDEAYIKKMLNENDEDVIG